MARAKRNETAAEEMRRILGKHTPEAVAFLVEIMRDGAQKPELRMKAAESILDRACGKAIAAREADLPPAPPAVILFEGELEEWSR
ncbi:MAG: hypothetical protein E7590_08570 [Ruminococcaceae bacterium]|nr:hypothetical protein [Oscillospiraceae bacterium]